LAALNRIDHIDMKKTFLASTLLLLQIAVGSVLAQEVFQRLSYPYEVREIRLHDGERMAYIDEGIGPEVLVFVHGENGYIPEWMKNIDEISQTHRCIAVDLIGYGKSSKPLETNLLTDHSAYIAELMDSLGINRYSLAGHAMGGQIAIHHSLTYRDRIHKLMLIAPTGIETFTHVHQRMILATPSSSVANSSQEAINANVRNNFFQYPEEAGFMITDRIAMAGDPEIEAYSHAVTSGIQGILEEPVFEQLEQIAVPTLVLFGAEDRVIPNDMYNPDLDQQQLLNKAQEIIPHAETHLIPAGGHLVMFERHDVVNALIIDFMKEGHLRR